MCDGDVMSADFWQQQEQELEQQWLVHNHIQYAQLELKHEKEMNMNIMENMSFDQLVPTESKYLKKDDVGEDGVILTIKGFTQETLKGDDGDEIKIVMHFQEQGYNPMVINRTNSQLIPIATGATVTGEAVGKQVVIYNDPTISFGGKVTGGLRIKKVPGAPKPALTAPEEDVPFN